MAAQGLELRPVRPSDRPRVEEMTADIWEGHDYLPHVFDEWVRDPNAWFTAAELDGQLVGLQRLKPIGPGILWLEGLRVATTHRRRGIAKALLEAAVEQSRGLAFQEIRLATANPDAAALFRKSGYRSLVEVDLWRARRLEGDEPARMPPPEEAARIWPLVSRDPALAAYGGVDADGGSALDISAGYLAELARKGQLRVAAGGRSVASVHTGWGGDRKWVGFISGSGAGLQDLLLALRFEADIDGMEGVNLWAPGDHPGLEDFNATGYDSASEPFRMYYFALALQPV